MNRILKVIVIILVLILIFLLVYKFTPIRKVIEKDYNKKIDFSCNVDEDCTIKDIGCDTCSGTRKGCVNKESREGICLEGIPRQYITCLVKTIPLTSCKCVNNKCKEATLDVNDKIYVSGGLRWEVEPGKPLTGVLGIQNLDDNLNSSAEFRVQIISTSNNGEPGWFILAPPGVIKAGEQGIVPIEVRIPKNIPTGSNYAFRITILKDNQEYASQAIIIVIKK